MQAVATQVLGSIFFYIVSLYMSKNNFGILNWANALSIFITTILSFGLEQIVIRRIAASNRSDWAATAFLLHAFAGSVLMLSVLILLKHLFPLFTSLQYLPWIFSAQAVLYIGAPLRAFLNAKEQFRPYGIIAIGSNLAKIILVFIFWEHRQLTIESVINILLICAGFELIALLLYVQKNKILQLNLRISAYLKLIKESLPQFTSVIFDSSLSRMDWILLGIMTTKELTADYSFAYRAFEITRLPLMIIAPVILPKFSRMLAASKLDAEKQKIINNLFSVEIFLSICIPLIFNMLWTPAVTAITQGKYGQSNQESFFILSLCIPFQFAINLMWTICFSAKEYIQIRNLTIITAITNIILNLVLIPVAGANGAAIAFLISTIVQATGFYILVKKTTITISLKSFFILMLIAGSCYYFSILLTNNLLLRVIISLFGYITLSILFKVIKTENLKALKSYLYK